MKFSLLAIVGIIVGVTAFGQSTPEQRYTDWANLPFPKEEYHARRDKAMAKLREQDQGILLIPSADGLSHGETFRQLDDFNYFIGLELPGSVLVINAKDSEFILFAPTRDFRFENPSRKNDFPGRPLADDPALKALSGIDDIQPIDNLDSYLQARMSNIFFVNNGSAAALNPLHTSFVTSWTGEQILRYHLEQTYPSIQIVNAFDVIASLRMIKSPLEIQTLKRAVDITIEGINKAVTYIKPGVDERTLEAEMEAEFKRGGSQRLPFASIIKSGPNSLWPWRILAAHYDRRNRKMNAGELVIFDVGCEFNYYVSDMGRTFPVSGKFTEEQRQILRMEMAVADAIIGAVKPGITFADLKQVADKSIPDEAKKYMQVGLHFGHHLGLSSGDPFDPYATLAPGMVFTVEPWYYNHNKGISVFTEDEVLVTDNGFELLTKELPRTPEGLEKMMSVNRK